MKIELKSIKLSVSLSEETPAYTARLYIDGKHFGDVSNHGQGGPDMVYPPKGVRNSDFQPRLTELEARIAKEMPKVDMSKYDMDDMEETLEGVCHRLVWEHDARRKLRSALSRKVLFTKDGKIYETKRSPGAIEAVRRDHPDTTILNELSLDEALAVYLGAS